MGWHCCRDVDLRFYHRGGHPVLFGHAQLDELALRWVVRVSSLSSEGLLPLKPCLVRFIFWGMAYLTLYPGAKKWAGIWRSSETVLNYGIILFGFYILVAGSYVSVLHLPAALSSG